MAPLPPLAKTKKAEV